MNEWRLIETAPKDGTPFLAWISGLPYAAKYDKDGRFIWYWHTDMACGPSYIIHDVDGKRLLEETRPQDPHDFQIIGHLWVNGFDDTPTYWMPITDPPKDADTPSPSERALAMEGRE